jgi:hypothetical protein
MTKNPILSASELNLYKKGKNSMYWHKKWSSSDKRPSRPTGDVQPYSFFNFAPDGGGWSMPHSGHFMLGKETWYPLYRRLGGPQSWSGSVENLTAIGIRSLDLPAKSELLYQIHYPGPQVLANIKLKTQEQCTTL